MIGSFIALFWNVRFSLGQCPLDRNGTVRILRNHDSPPYSTNSLPYNLQCHMIWLISCIWGDSAALVFTPKLNRKQMRLEAQRDPRFLGDYDAFIWFASEFSCIFTPAQMNRTFRECASECVWIALKGSGVNAPLVWSTIKELCQTGTAYSSTGRT